MELNHNPIHQLVVRQHKELVSKFVLPVMSAMSVFYFVYLFRWEVIGVFTFALVNAFWNIYLTSKQRIHHLPFGIVFDSRSDSVDTFRWAFNLLCVDIIFFGSMHPSYFVLTLSWCVLVLCAHADTFGRRHRAFITTIGLLAYLLVSRIYYDKEIDVEVMFSLLMMGSVLFIFSKIEGYWRKSLEEQYAAQEKEKLALIEAEKLRTDAVLGSQSRHISHELNNMIMVIDATAVALRRTVPADNLIVSSKIAQVERAVHYIRKINRLVMDTAKFQSERREIHFNELVEDIELLTRKLIENRGVDWTLLVEDGVRLCQFIERQGSTYLIVHNIVKNAAESFENQDLIHKPAIKVELMFKPAISSDRADHGYVQLSITDNGIGMKPEVLDAVLKNEGVSSKRDGHGLGLKFVVSECEKNGYKIQASTREKEGTMFMILIPLSRAVPQVRMHEPSS